MAKQRYINTNFWEDDFIAELNSPGKLLFLYLLTNPQTNIAGAYQITIRRMVFDTGLERSVIVALLEYFEQAEKAIYRADWLFLPNFIKHQNAASPKIKNAIIHTLKTCPQWVIDTVSIRYGYGIDTIAIPLARNLNFNSNSNLNNGVNSGRATRTPEAAGKPIRLPKDFSLTSEMLAWAHDLNISEDINLGVETEQFKNHYSAQKGDKGVSIDWLAIWKNWILREQKFLTRDKRNDNKSTGNGDHDFSKFDAIQFAD